MKRLQTTKYKLLVNINGVYQIVVDSPISSITSKEQIPNGIHIGHTPTPTLGALWVSDGEFNWIDTAVTKVEITSVSSKIIG